MSKYDLNLTDQIEMELLKQDLLNYNKYEYENKKERCKDNTRLTWLLTNTSVFILFLIIGAVYWKIAYADHKIDAKEMEILFLIGGVLTINVIFLLISIGLSLSHKNKNCHVSKSSGYYSIKKSDGFGLVA